MKAIALVLIVLFQILAVHWSSAQNQSGRKQKTAKAVVPALDSLAWKVGDEGRCSGSVIAVDGKENVFVAGWYEDTVRFADRTLISEGEKDIFIAKYDRSGILQWTNGLRSKSSNYVSSLCLDKKGNVLITGYFKEKLAFGDTSLISSGDYDVFLAKYDNDGNFKWARRFGGKGSDGGSSLACDDTCNIYLVGSFTETAAFQDTLLTASGPEDAFVALLSPAGNLEWVRRGGGAGYDHAYGVALDSKGNAYITGKFQGIADFGEVRLEFFEEIDIAENNGYVVKCSPNGRFEWGKRAGGTIKSDIHKVKASLRGIVADNQDNIYVYGAGYFKDNGASIGDKLFTTAMPFDAIIAKINAAGVVEWVMNTIFAGVNQGGLGTDDYGNLYGLTSFGYYPLRIGARNSEQTINSRGELDFALVKFDNEGNLTWVKQYGGAGSENINGMALSAQGNFHILGSFHNTVVLAGTKLATEGESGTFVMKVPNR